jgi:tripartite-type tricarboxylate transporter receptor subunit TctC
LPQTPTVAESGLPGFNVSLWVGVFVPSRTPGTITGLLARELDSTLRSVEVRELLVEQGFETGAVAPEAFAKLIREDLARWRKVISETGLKPE